MKRVSKRVCLVVGLVCAFSSSAIGAAPAASAGVGNCTAGYIEQIPSTPPTNQGGLFTGYLDCVVTDQENCINNANTSPQGIFDLIACSINRPS